MTADSDVIGIIQPFVPNYRLGLFNALAARLEREGLRLEVWHAQPKGRVAARGNAATGPWSVPISQHRLSIGRRNVTVRNVQARARKARAVIAGLASTNLETYGLALDPAVRLMLWGHGRNYTAANNALDESVEGWLRRRSAHIFTYTESGRAHLIERGSSPDDVTVVQNSTDTVRLREIVHGLPSDAERTIREELGLHGARVGLFVGAFDEPKKLPLLFEASALVAQQRSDFVLLVAGAGPDEAIVQEATQRYSHVRLIGRADATALARLSKVAEFIAIPGRVGLVAVDALALGIPIITTDYPHHAPEAEYLTPGLNSLWTEQKASSYADGMLRLLNDTDLRRQLSEASLTAGGELSVELSAERFVGGILRGLAR